MKKFSFLSFAIIAVGLCFCVSCGYLISTAIVSTSIFNYNSSACFEKQNIYAISMSSSITESNLSEKISELQSQNGAGYVYKQNEKFYLLASLYENINDAEKVKNNLKTSGVEAEVIKIELASQKLEGNFSSQEKTILTNCLSSDFKTFKSLYDVSISLDTNVFDKTQAKTECNSIFSEQISVKANFEAFFEEKLEMQVFSALKTNLTNTNTALSNLINENFFSQAQTFSSLVKYTYCKILLE